MSSGDACSAMAFKNGARAGTSVVGPAVAVCVKSVRDHLIATVNGTNPFLDQRPAWLDRVNRG